MDFLIIWKESLSDVDFVTKSTLPPSQAIRSEIIVTLQKYATPSITSSSTIVIKNNTRMIVLFKWDSEFNKQLHSLDC